MIFGMKAKLAGVIGYPLEFSMAPYMHNAAFRDLNLNNFYSLIEVEEEDLKDVVKGISKMNFIGFNVTSPYKVEIMKYLDEIDEKAEVIGAVNTVLVKDKRLIGYNTDGEGFVSSLKEDAGIDCKGKSILLIGAGGACRSIATTIAFNEAKKLYLTNRTVEKAQVIADVINSKVRECCQTIEFKNEYLQDVMENVDIIINTTTVGMYPNVEDCPIDTNLLRSNHIVADAIYNPIKTKLLLEAEKKGCRIVNGRGMLVRQGAKAFEIWTGIKAPIEVMAKSINELKK